MDLKAMNCPNCGADYHPANYQCAYCGSYVFMSNKNYADFSDIKIQLPQKPREDSGKYPGIYVYGRLLGAGEKPITLGAANYFTGLLSAGGKLLLTNKSLCFSAHGFNVGKKETKIELDRITDVKVSANMPVSQHILVSTREKSHKFVVYHGSDWVRKIKEAMAEQEAQNSPIPQSKAGDGNYIEQLQKLKQLLDQGVITEEEFSIKKRMLLGI